MKRKGRKRLLILRCVYTDLMTLLKSLAIFKGFQGKGRERRTWPVFLLTERL